MTLGFDLTQDGWLQGIPKSQALTIEAFLSAGNSEEQVAELWLSKIGSPTTVGFGGAGPLGSFYLNVKAEFVAFVCGAIADPFLALLKRLLWPNQEPTLAEGRLAAVWTIDHVRRTTPGGVGGDIQLATLTDASPSVAESVKLAEQNEVAEHLQAVEAALQALVSQIRGVATASDTVEPPAFEAAASTGP